MRSRRRGAPGRPRRSRRSRPPSGRTEAPITTATPRSIAARVLALTVVVRGVVDQDVDAVEGVGDGGVDGDPERLRARVPSPRTRAGRGPRATAGPQGTRSSAARIAGDEGPAGPAAWRRRCRR